MCCRFYSSRVNITISVSRSNGRLSIISLLPCLLFGSFPLGCGEVSGEKEGVEGVVVVVVVFSGKPI